jgi:hypothetical protein
MSGIRKCLCECYMRCLKESSTLWAQTSVYVNVTSYVWKNKLLRIWAEWENVYVNVTCYVWKE